MAHINYQTALPLVSDENKSKLEEYGFRVPEGLTDIAAQVFVKRLEMTQKYGMLNTLRGLFQKQIDLSAGKLLDLENLGPRSRR